jgi:hypothetical protein
LGMASFIETFMMSPTWPYRVRELPLTLMHIAIRAPVLSQTLSREYICIT